MILYDNTILLHHLQHYHCTRTLHADTNINTWAPRLCYISQQRDGTVSQWWGLAVQLGRSEEDIAAQIATWHLNWLVISFYYIFCIRLLKFGHRAAAAVRIYYIIIINDVVELERLYRFCQL